MAHQTVKFADTNVLTTGQARKALFDATGIMETEHHGDTGNDEQTKNKHRNENAT